MQYIKYTCVIILLILSTEVTAAITKAGELGEMTCAISKVDESKLQFSLEWKSNSGRSAVIVSSKATFAHRDGVTNDDRIIPRKSLLSPNKTITQMVNIAPSVLFSASYFDIMFVVNGDDEIGYRCNVTLGESDLDAKIGKIMEAAEKAEKASAKIHCKSVAVRLRMILSTVVVSAEKKDGIWPGATPEQIKQRLTENANAKLRSSEALYEEGHKAGCYE